MVFSFPNNAVVAEIGVRRGEFSKIIYDLKTPKELYLIDLWESHEEYKKDPINKELLSQYYENVCNDFKDIPSVKIIRDWSHLAAEKFPDKYFDWVFLDANHSYDAVKKDLIAWFPKIKSGGIFSGHDYTLHKWIGVKPAVDEFMEENGLELSHLTTETLQGLYYKNPIRENPGWAFKIP
jgi:hypothetical protein